MNRLFILLLLSLILGCSDITDYSAVDTRGKILIFNGLAESFSLLDIDGESISNDVQLTGIWPNHITYSTDIILTNSGSNSITILEEETLFELESIYLGEGKNPWMVIPTTDSLYIPCYVSNEVIKVDRTTWEILDYIPVGNAPEGGVILGEYLFIGNTGDDTISIINTSSDTVEETITLSYSDMELMNPQSLIGFSDLNEVHIICTGLNASSETVDDGLVIVLNADTFEVKEYIEVGGSPVYNEGAINYSDKLVYLYGTTGISVYNYETYEVLESGIDDYYASGIIYISETDRLYVSDFQENSIKIYSGSDYSYERELQASDGPQQLLYIKE